MPNTEKWKCTTMAEYVATMINRWQAEEELELAALPPERREEMEMYWASESYWRRAGDAARPEYEI